MQGDALTALIITMLAGLSTGLGGLVVLVARKPSTKVLSFGLGFSGGVMVFVSLAELLPEAQEQIGEGFGESAGQWIAYACFFGGILLSRGLDALLPEPEANPHEVVPIEDLERVAAAENGGDPTANGGSKALARLGVLTALAITVHNFPEGIATLVSAMSDTSLGLSVAAAVAVHNIPEGISVAVLVYFGTRSRKKAFLLSLASGLAEPLGAVLVYLVLAPFISTTLVGAMLATVAGIMVFISFDELLPTARQYDAGHLEISGVVLGMAVMAVSLALF